MVFVLMSLSSVIILTIVSDILIFRPLYDVSLLNPDALLSQLNDPKVVEAMKLSQLISSIGLFIIPGFFFARLVSVSELAYLRLKKIPSLTGIALIIILMYISLPFFNWMVEVNNELGLPESYSWLEELLRETEDKYDKLTEAFLDVDTIPGLAYNLILIAFIPALGEELMFRGILQKLFGKISRNVHIGIWITAILFSAIHGQFYAFLPRMFLGAMFGYLLVWSNTLWVPILAHFVNNATIVVVMYLRARGVIELDIDSIGADQGAQIFNVISLFGTIVILYIFYRNRKESKIESYN